MRVPIALIAWGATALLAPALSDASEERVRLVLFSGERLEGRVYDLGDQYLELSRTLGSTRLAKSQVESWGLSVDAELETFLQDWRTRHAYNPRETIRRAG